LNIGLLEFASIDFAWDDTLLVVHSCTREVALEVELEYVHNALDNKVDEDFVVLASHD
jgi:hypothetical protein